jgi:hypothetical protein
MLSFFQTKNTVDFVLTYNNSFTNKKRNKYNGKENAKYKTTLKSVD